MEAMAYGLPTVSFDCKTGPSDIITHGVDGLLIENGNTEKLTKALDQLMANSKLRLQFSQQAIKITHKFNIDSIAKQWNSLFTQLKNNV
jgi:glycosyltransferase involved in cell wall biosynthesis